MQEQIFNTQTVQYILRLYNKLKQKNISAISNFFNSNQMVVFMKHTRFKLFFLTIFCYMALFMCDFENSVHHFALGNISTAEFASDNHDCLTHILAAEKKYNLPSGLLLAISLVESGYEGKPHPYAMHLNGKSVFANDLKEASSHMRLQNGKLKPNISVGCMQLQVYYHKGHFDPVENILVPAENVDYAGRFLADLRYRFKNWTFAVRRYNGGSHPQMDQYLCKVYSHLKVLNPETAKLIYRPSCARNKAPYIAAETKEAFAEHKS